MFKKCVRRQKKRGVEFLSYERDRGGGGALGLQGFIITLFFLNNVFPVFNF